MCGKIGVMPRYVYPESTAAAEEAIVVLGSLTNVAVLGALAEKGPMTAAEVASALGIGRPVVKRCLYLLAEQGVILADPPQAEVRSGQRVKYRVVLVEIEKRYLQLGRALRIRQ